MTQEQIKEKVAALADWLIRNPQHPDYGVMLQDKKDLELKLKTLEKIEL